MEKEAENLSANCPKKYLMFAKNRNPSQRTIRNAIKAQIGYVRRNFKTIDQMLEKEPGLIELLGENKLDWILILCKFNYFINLGIKNRTIPQLA